MNNIIPYEVFKKKRKELDKKIELVTLREQLDRFGLLREDKVYLKGQEIPNLLKDRPFSINFFD